MGRFRHLVLVMVALVVASGATTASAADTAIGFEDQAAGVAVGAQYSGLGVQLDPPSSLAVATGGPGVPAVLPHAGTKLLRATDHTCAPGTNVSFTGLFSSPRTTVGIWVHDPFTADPSSHTVTLQAFNAAGGDVGQTSLSITSALGWQQLLLPVVPGTSIDHFTVSVETGICDMLFDDLTFDPPAGGTTPAVTWEGVTTSPVAVERGAVAGALAVVTVLFVPLHLLEPYFVTTGMPHLWWALLGLAMAVSVPTAGAESRPR